MPFVVSPWKEGLIFNYGFFEGSEDWSERLMKPVCSFCKVEPIFCSHATCYPPDDGSIPSFRNVYEAFGRKISKNMYRFLSARGLVGWIVSSYWKVLLFHGSGLTFLFRNEIFCTKKTWNCKIRKSQLSVQCRREILVESQLSFCPASPAHI